MYMYDGVNHSLASIEYTSVVSITRLLDFNQEFMNILSFGRILGRIVPLERDEYIFNK